MPSTDFGNRWEGALADTWAAYMSSKRGAEDIASRACTFGTFGVPFSLLCREILIYLKQGEVPKDELMAIPEDVIVEIADLFISYLALDTGDGPLDAYLYVGGNKSIPPGDFFITSKFIFPSKDNVEGSAARTPLSAAREDFLVVLECMSVMPLNRVTRDVMCKRLGYNFARIVVETVHYFIDKVEEVSVSWIDTIGSSTAAVRGPTASDGGLNDDTKFVLSALHLLINFIQRSAPSCSDTISRLSCNILPRQPWTEQECEELGFKLGRNASGGFRAPAGSSSRATEKIFPAEVQPLTCADSSEQWVKEFIFAGCIRVTVSLLRKLVFLSGALRKIVDYKDSIFCQEQYLWTSCLVLETEGLTTLAAIIVTNPTLGYSRFHNCSGAEVGSMILSCKDGVPHYIRECPLILGLIVQRGLVCIRIAEIMLRASKASLARVENVIDIDVSLANLTGFMTFLHVYGYHLDFKRGKHEESRTEESELIKAQYFISCSTENVVISPTPTSDLWPWCEASLADTPGPALEELPVASSRYTMCRLRLPDAVAEMPETNKDRSISPDSQSAATFPEKFRHFHGIRQLHEICSGRYTLNPFVIVDYKCGTVSNMGVNIAQVWRYLFDTLLTVVMNTDSSNVIRGEKNEIVACLSTVIANAVAGTMTCLSTEVRTENKAVLPPILQGFLLLFLSKLMAAYPIETVVICRRCNTWKLLAQSSTFLKGGRAEADRVLKLCTITKTPHDGAVPSITLDFEVIPPSSTVFRKPNISRLSHKQPTPQLNKSRSVRFNEELPVIDEMLDTSVFEGGERDRLKNNSPTNTLYSISVGHLESQASQSSVWSVDTKATAGNRTAEFEDYFSGSDDGSGDDDEYDEHRVSPVIIADSGSAAALVSEITMSPSVDLDPNTSKMDLSIAEENRGLTTSGFFWMLIHDAILDIFALSITALNSNSNFVASKQGPKPEIDSLLGTLSSSTPDFMITRIMRLLDHLFGMSFARRGDASGLEKMKLSLDQLLHSCGHVMTKCLSICKYHVTAMSTGDSSEKKSMPLLWIDDPKRSTTSERPFAHPMRSAVLSLMLNICTISPQLAWNSMQISDISIIYPYRTAYYKQLFSSSSGGGAGASGRSLPEADNSAVNSHIRKVQSKYFVLLQMLLLPDCRDAVLFILTELISYYSSLIKSEYSVGAVTTPTLSPDLNNDELDVQHLQSGLYMAYIHDILKWLLLHIRCAPQQPSRCGAVALSSRIFEWLTCLLRSPDRLLCTKHHQHIIDCYGALTIFHRSLAWPASRFNMFREVFRSIDPCLQVGGAGIDIIRYALSFLTALMINNDIGKEKFHSLMLMQKRKSTTKQHAGNDSFAMQFPYRTCNLHDLCDIIVAAESRLSVATIQLFLDMLLDGNSPESKSEIVLNEPLQDEGLFRFVDGVPLICNTTALPILFALLPQCDIPLQKFLINTLKNLIMGHNSVINMSKCSQMQPPVIDMILDVFLDLNPESHAVAKDLIQTMGRHNISVSQLKRIFGLMQGHDKYRPSCTWRLLSALQGMITPSIGPKHYILFEGKDSGLSLPPVLLPVRSSYAFSLWFCVDSQHTDRVRDDSTATDESVVSLFMTVNSPTSPRKSKRLMPILPHTERLEHQLSALGYRSSAYCPTLLSMRNEFGDGLEVFLKQDNASPNEFTLVIKTYRNKGDVSKNGKVEIQVCRDEHDNVVRPVSEGIWHFLAISHSDGTFRNRGEISVLLDNNFSRHSLQFPKLKEAIPELFIGDCVESLRPPATNTTLRGRVGAIYFFHEALSESHLRYIYQRGPSYAGHFSHRDTIDTSESFLSSMLDGVLSTSIMLAYNPAVFSGSEILDYTPQKNLIRCKKVKSKSGSMPSEVGKEDTVLSTSGVRARKHTGTHCCTTRDIRDALYCLGGYNVLLPIFSQFDQPVLDADGAENFDVDPKLCVTVLELLFALLHDIPAIDHKSRLCGFELTGYFLERVSPAHLNLHVFDTIIALLSDPDWDPAWHKFVIQYLLVNFKLWVYTPFHVQNKLFLYIMKLFGQYPIQMRELLPFQSMLDLLSTLYALPREPTDAISDKKVPMDTESSSAWMAENLEEANSDEDTDVNFGHRDAGGVNTASAVWAKFGYDAPKWIHPFSGEVVGAKLQGSELDTIRRYLFDMAFDICLLAAQNENEPVEMHIQDILRMLTVTQGQRATVQVLQFFLKIISHAPDRGVGPNLFAHRLIAGLSIQSRVFPILNLCRHPQGSIRILGFAAFCNIVQIVVSYGNISSIGGKPSKISNETKMALAAEEFDALDLHNFDFEADDEGGAKTPPERARAHSITVDEMLNTIRSSAVDVPMSPAGALGGADSFSAIGIPHRTLDTIFLWIQRKLHQFITSECRAGDHSQINFYCRLVIATMQYTMMGKSSLNFFSSLLDPSMSVTTTFVSALDELNNTKLSVDSNILESNIFVTEICTVMLFVPILYFVQHNIVPSSFRLSTIVNLKTTLHCYSNIESVLRAPHWLPCMFQLLSTEEEKIQCLEKHLQKSELSNSFRSSTDDLEESGSVVDSDELLNTRVLLMKEINRSKGVVETAIRMFSDFMAHAMQHGVPKTAPFVVRPPHVDRRGVGYRRANGGDYGSDFAQPLPFSDMLVEIQLNKRVLGVTLLHDYIGYMRFYAETKYLEVRGLGLNLLQQMIDVTKREVHFLNQAAPLSSDLFSKLRMRFLLINIWLLTSIILEFITLPVVVPQAVALSPSFLTRSSSAPLTPNVYQPPEEKHSRRLSGSSVTMSPVLGPQEQISGIMLDDAALTGSGGYVKRRVSATNGALQAMRSFEFTHQERDETSTSDDGSEYSERGSDVSVDCIEAFEERSRRRSRSTSHAHESAMGLVDEARSLERERRRVAKSKADVDYTYIEWKLLDSMLDLVESLDNDADITATTRSYRFRLGLKIGLKSAMELSNQVHLTIDKIAGVSTAPKSFINTMAEGTQLEYASTNVCWTIARVLCDFFVKGASNGPKCWNISTLPRLKVVLAALKEKDDAHMLEALYIVNEIAMALSKCVQPASSPWVREAVMFLVLELSTKRREIATLLLKAYNNDARKSLMSMKTSSSTSVISDPPVSNSFRNLSFTGDDRTSPAAADRPTIISRLKYSSQDVASGDVANFTDKFDINVMFASLSGSGMVEHTAFTATTIVDKAINDLTAGSTSDITLELINSVLNLAPDYRVFSWVQWAHALSAINKGAIRREEETTCVRLTKLGQHRLTEALKKQQVTREKRLLNCYKRLNSELELLGEGLVNAETSRVEATWRTHSAHARKQKARWNIILQDLASERGIWGLGAGGSSQKVFFKLCPSENEFRMRPLVLRNPLGSRHEYATRLTNPKDLSVAPTTEEKEKNEKGYCKLYYNLCVVCSFFNDL